MQVKVDQLYLSFLVLWLEASALCTLGECSSAELHSQPLLGLAPKPGNVTTVHQTSQRI